MNFDIYEDIMVNSTGKRKAQIWKEKCVEFFETTYKEDLDIYGIDTKELYECLFPEGTQLFEDIDSACFVIEQLNEGEGDEDPLIKVNTAKINGVVNNVKDFGATFIQKIKGMTGTAGLVIKKGIAGVIANPWPLIAAGVGATAIITLIKKFKKLSDDKKKLALLKLDKATQKKVELMLTKNEKDLKLELEKGKK
jgi:hypothetical protein